MILEKMANQEDLETMAHWELRVNAAHLELTEIKENEATMVQPDQTGLEERKANLERKGSKVLVGTEAPEEKQASQDPVESKEGRAQLAPTETPVSLVNKGLLATEGTRASLDQRDPKGQEESKELQETEASWGSGEKMVPQETAQLVVMVSRVILDLVETLASRAVRGPQDPKETMENPEIQALTTTNRGFQDLKGPKATEDLRASRGLLDLLDHQELMSVKFWISS